MGGPSATINASGILNSDWFITNGGDGFESATDWENPNITYAQAQYGWIVRYDKASGEKVPIQPILREMEKLPIGGIGILLFWFRDIMPRPFILLRTNYSNQQIGEMIG